MINLKALILSAIISFTTPNFLISENWQKMPSDYGELYYKDKLYCYLYIPEEINDKTAALLYYGGGYSNGFVLDPYLIETYVRDYTPNCIGVFFLGSGWNHYENWCHIGLDYINKLANYCNIEIKNL